MGDKNQLRVLIQAGHHMCPQSGRYFYLEPKHKLKLVLVLSLHLVQRVQNMKTFLFGSRFSGSLKGSELETGSPTIHVSCCFISVTFDLPLQLLLRQGTIHLV